MTVEKTHLQITDLVAAFRDRLPYETVPTNVPGVLATAAIPRGFDPRSASVHDLVKHGLLWRRPKEGDSDVVKRAWARAFEKPWLPENNVVPEIKTHPGRIHRRTGDAVENGPPSPLENNWGGIVLPGTWTTVSSYWTVPKVSKPTEKSGVGGGWVSSTWIGIDGDGTDDVLQAGTTQSVGTDGHASYYAWFEWYVAFSKVTLGDTTPSNFALLSDGGGNLFLAFRGEQNHLDILFSSTSGQSFGNKMTSSETTGQGPALALHEGQVFVAWTGTSNHRINVAPVTLTGAKIALGTKFTLSDTSSTGPALASFNGVLFLAWRDANDFLTVASSTDGGKSFMRTFTTTVLSPHAPSLAVHDEKLFIAWQSEKTDVLDVGTVTVSDGIVSGIGNIVSIRTETTPLGPSIASNGNVLFISWKGDGNDHLSVMQSTDGGRTFFDKYSSPESSPSSPVLALHEDRMFIGWRGENDHLDVSVVGYRDGAIQGFTPAPYLAESEITNFPVHPGDEIVCSVFYLDNMSAGYIALGNVTTGKHFSITLYPPPAADVTGGTIEWIVETPSIGGQLTVLPKFPFVTFTDAFGCGPNAMVGNPQNGIPTEVVNAAGTTVTAVSTASDTVTIVFTG